MSSIDRESRKIPFDPRTSLLCRAGLRTVWQRRTDHATDAQERSSHYFTDALGIELNDIGRRRRPSIGSSRGVLRQRGVGMSFGVSAEGQLVDQCRLVARTEAVVDIHY